MGLGSGLGLTTAHRALRAQAEQTDAVVGRARLDDRLLAPMVRAALAALPGRVVGVGLGSGFRVRVRARAGVRARANPNRNPNSDRDPDLGA